ncbi:MAG: transglutaminase domain-containing protein, partial [Clostridia bacterium]|nr:transglutaminase domain-containing protein [Clostridia bacterium]
MKKFRLLVTVIAVIALLTLTAFAETVYKDKLVTSNDDVSINFEVTDNALVVSGMVENEECQYLIINIDASYVLPVSSDMKFTTKIDLSKISSERVTVGIFLGKNLTDAFKSVFFGDDIVLEKSDEKFLFPFESTVLDENTAWLSAYVSTNDHLSTDIPSAVKTITSNVVSGLETDYEKARAIHRWVADNIYYDENYAL